MKYIRLDIVFLILVTSVILSCGDISGTDSKPPAVEIITPETHTDINQGQIVTIIAEASDNVEIKNVDFYINGSLTSTATTYPYQYLWDTSNAEMDNEIFCKAYDSSDNEATSASIHVTVIIPTQLVFFDNFQYADNWELSTSGNSGYNVAIAEISESMLKLKAIQEWGTPQASAKLNIPDSLKVLFESNNIEISAHVSRWWSYPFHNNCSIYLWSERPLMGLILPHNNDDFNLKIRLLYDLGIAMIYVDDILVDETTLNIESLEYVSFKVSASNADGNASGIILLSDFSLSLYYNE